jgi:hypothetical protein
MVDTMSSRSNRSRPSIGIIGDFVRSRRVKGTAREDLQRRLLMLLRELNHRHTKAILARFVVTTGDEFQGLLSDGTVIPDLIWTLDKHLRTRIDVRIGIGHGVLDTPLKKEAIGMDGPVWHNARAAIVEAKQKNRLGGVFRGFPEPDETILNGVARLLHKMRQDLTQKQFMIVDKLRGAPNQSAIADALKISKQVVSKQALAAGFEAYREGETAWRAALKTFDHAALWR